MRGFNTEVICSHTLDADFSMASNSIHYNMYMSLRIYEALRLDQFNNSILGL